MFKTIVSSAQSTILPEQIERANRLSARHSSVFLTIEAALKAYREMVVTKDFPPVSIERAAVEVTAPGSASPIFGHQITVRESQGRALSIRSATDTSVEFGLDAELGTVIMDAYGYHAWEPNSLSSPLVFDASLVVAVLEQWLSGANKTPPFELASQVVT